MQVAVPLSLQRRVEGLLQEFLDRAQSNSQKANDGVLESKAAGENVNLDENPDSFLDGSVMEKVLQRRSLRLRNMQRSWQVLFNLIWSISVQKWAHIVNILDTEET